VPASTGSKRGEATVLPGLIDAHVHLVADSGLTALDRVAGHSPEEIDTVVTGALRGQLAAGVTTVRDLGDRNFNVVERRDAQRQVDDGLPPGHLSPLLAAIAATSAAR
jgi:imidazolonepropionase-like amidohydrolase